MIGVLRPAEHLQEAARIEDVPALPFGPIRLHQSHQVDMFELAGRSGNGVHQVNTGAIALGRERLPLHFMPDGRDEGFGIVGRSS